MNYLPSLDVVVLVAYLLGIVGIGLWCSRKTAGSEQFMAAGRAIPGWAVGLSIFGTYVSSISFLALPGKALAENWNPFVFSLSIPLATWIAVRWFVPFYRHRRELSAYEHLEQRFGPWARSYAAVCYLLTQIARMAVIMYLLALALAPLTGWSIPSLILLTGGLVIVYTLFGGMEAVIWTDVVQSIVFIVGAAACVVVLFAGMPEGPRQLFEVAARDDKFSLGSYSLKLDQSTFWVVLVYGLTINLQNFGIDQSYVQRYQTADSDAAANRSVWLGALLYLPLSAVLLLIGTGLFAFYTIEPGRLPAGVSISKTPDAVFPYFIAHELPAGFAGLVIASVFAAAQSTISSSINCSATLVLCDFYRRYFRPDAGDRESLAVLRVSTLAFGVIGTVAALAMMQIHSALDVWWKLAGMFSGGMLGLFLLGQLSRRAGSAAAAIGVTLGIAVIAWITLSISLPVLPIQLRSPLHDYLAIVLGTLTVLAVGLFVAAAMDSQK